MTANDRGIRYARRPASRGADRDARQAEHVIPRVRRQATRGRGAQPALHDHGRARERARAAGNKAVSWRRSLYSNED